MIYRRICVLRARGLSVEAARLQSTELSRAVRALRQSLTGDADGEAQLRALFAREEERVANASVLAEILLPMLRESATASAPRALATAPSLAAAPPSADRRRSSRPPAAATAPGIADFIDEMIQQERAAPGTSAP